MAFRGLVRLGVQVPPVQLGETATPQTLVRPVPRGRLVRLDKVLQGRLDRVVPRAIPDAQVRLVLVPQAPLVPQEPRVQVARLGVLEQLALGRPDLLDQAAPLEPLALDPPVLQDTAEAPA